MHFFVFSSFNVNFHSITTKCKTELRGFCVDGSDAYIMFVLESFGQILEKSLPKIAIKVYFLKRAENGSLEGSIFLNKLNLTPPIIVNLSGKFAPPQ